MGAMYQITKCVVDLLFCSVVAKTRCYICVLLFWALTYLYIPVCFRGSLRAENIYDLYAHF